jgi:hypothetical protein
MTFREKSRWLALVVDLMIWSWYFRHVYAALPNGPADETDFLWLAAFATIGGIIVHVTALVAFALVTPAEAAGGLDERERAIERSAGAAAYTILAVGLVSVILASYSGWSKFATVNAVLLVFVAAEISRYLIEIFAYRRAAA